MGSGLAIRLECWSQPDKTFVGDLGPREARPAPLGADVQSTTTEGNA
jgi:hypothetical protein